MFDRTLAMVGRSEALNQALSGAVTAYSGAFLAWLFWFVFPCLISGSSPFKSLGVVFLGLVFIALLSLGLVPVGALYGYLTWCIVRAGAPMWLVLLWAVLAAVVAPFCVCIVFGGPASGLFGLALGGPIFALPCTCIHAYGCWRSSPLREASSPTGRSS